MVWFSRRLFLLVSNHTETLTHRILDWSQRHRRLGLLGPNLADPAQPETPGLAILAILLLALSWVGYSLLWGWTPPLTPAELDAAIYNLFQNLHTPWTDTLALSIAQFGTWQVYLPMSVAVLAGLLAARRTMAAAHWCAALGFGAALAFGLTVLLRIPAPVDYYNGVSSGYLSGHLIMSTVCYGYLAVLLATRKRPSRRWRYYGVAVTGIVLIALARLYIGAQWFSDVLLGMGIGVTWVSVLSLGYRRHLPQRVTSISQMPLAMGILLVAASWQWYNGLDTDRARYRPSAEPLQMTAPQWQQQEFSNLPAYRVDLAERRRYPLNLQWQGDITIIRAQLEALGWQDHSAFHIKQALLWLSKTRPIDELALLPQVHDGRPQALAMLLPVNTEQQWVLRLWHSGWQLHGQALWLGSIAPYRIENLLDNMRVPWLEGDFDAGPALLKSQFPTARTQRHPQALADPAGTQWNGQVLLLQSPTLERQRP
jgi:undecaprenyl-diphosphatase